MPKTFAPNKRSRYAGTDRGKCFCWSIPYHELKVLDDLERNAHMEMCSSTSQYLRRLVRRDTEQKNKQLEETKFDWSSMCRGN